MWHPIGWFWFSVVLSPIVLSLAFLAFGGKYRLACAAALSLIGLLLVTLFAVRGMRTFDQAGIGLEFSSGRAKEEYALWFTSGSGGLELGFLDIRNLMHEAEMREPRAPWVTWYPTGPRKQYPLDGDEGWPSVFRRWGFRLDFVNEADRPGDISNCHRWQFVFPAFFPVPFLLLFPSLYASRRWLRPWRRRRQNRCVACGYPLHGLPPDHPCPECGRTRMPASATVARPCDTPST
jgi:hypothetical protein